MKIEDQLWVEKYRPKTIKDVVLTKEYEIEFQGYVNKQTIPNLLMAGPPGAGKTTVARIITSKHGVIKNKADNLLEINGSSKETRGISFVQDVIEPYLKVPPAGDKYKIVFIDECDYLTDQSAHSFRNIIEKYSEKYARFIFTCNYLSKVPEAIQSRFSTYIFKQLPVEFVTDYSKKILETEKVKYTKEDLKFLIDNLYPDVRKIVSNLQRFSGTGTLKVNKENVVTTERVIISNIVEIVVNINENNFAKVNKNISNLVNLFDVQDLEYRNIYTQLFFMKAIPVPAKIVINKYSNSHSSCLVPNMHALSMIFEIVQALKNYKKVSG